MKTFTLFKHSTGVPVHEYVIQRPRGFPYTPEAHAEVLTEFVDRIGLDDFTLGVHDFGGPIGVPLALAERSRVARIVLMNTWMWPFDDDRVTLANAGHWPHEEEPEAVIEAMRRFLNRTATPLSMAL